jgi:hypothetical protein
MICDPDRRDPESEKGTSQGRSAHDYRIGRIISPLGHAAECRSLHATPALGLDHTKEGR